MRALGFVDFNVHRKGFSDCMMFLKKLVVVTLKSRFIKKKKSLAVGPETEDVTMEQQKEILMSGGQMSAGKLWAACPHGLSGRT